MKKLIAIAALLAFVLSGCSFKDAYDEGYDEGYDSGWEAAVENVLSDSYWEGYADGQEDLQNRMDLDYSETKELWEILEEAEWYARERGEWFAYEAAENIAAYLDGDTSVSKNDFEESAWVLYCFFEYLEQIK